MKLSVPSLLVGAVALTLLGLPGNAQIERLTLEQMVSRTDDAVFGEIVEREVFRVDHPVDGPELYFTTVYIKGESLYSGEQKTVPVTFMGGFIDEEHGVYNSESPSASETRVGRRVVAFFHWTDNMGGDVAANALYASHGGLYTTFGGTEPVAQGRGEGYAISRNVPITTLRTQMKSIRDAQGK